MFEDMLRVGYDIKYEFESLEDWFLDTEYSKVEEA